MLGLSPGHPVSSPQWSLSLSLGHEPFLVLFWEGFSAVPHVSPRPRSDRLPGGRVSVVLLHPLGFAVPRRTPRPDHEQRFPSKLGGEEWEAHNGL